MRARSVVREAWSISCSSVDYWILAFVASLLTAFSSAAYSPLVFLVFRRNVSPSSHVSGSIYVMALIAWVALVVAIFFQAALIQAVAAKTVGGESTKIRERLRSQFDNWKRLLTFLILLHVPAFVFIIALVSVFNSFIGSLVADPSGAVASGNAFAPLLLLIPLVFCGFLPMMIVLAILGPFVMRALVIENLGVGESIKRGFTLLRQNLGGFFRYALLMFAILIIPLIMIQVIMSPIRAAASAPIQAATQACLEQSIDITSAMDCSYVINDSLWAMMAQMLPLFIQSAPSSLVLLLNSAAFTVFYCRILQVVPLKQETLEYCTWSDAQARLLTRVDPKYRLTAHLSSDDGLATAQLGWSEQRVTDPTHWEPLMAAADELLCVQPPIDLVIAEIRDDAMNVQGIGMWMRPDMEAGAVKEFVYERLE